MGLTLDEAIKCIKTNIYGDRGDLASRADDRIKESPTIYDGLDRATILIPPLSLFKVIVQGYKYAIRDQVRECRTESQKASLRNEVLFDYLRRFLIRDQEEDEGGCRTPLSNVILARPRRLRSNQSREDMIARELIVALLYLYTPMSHGQISREIELPATNTEAIMRDLALVWLRSNFRYHPGSKTLELL